MGRPRLVDGRIERRLARLLDAGVSQQDAAKVVGISLRTVSRYVHERRAKTDEPEPESLDQLLRRFEARFEEQLLAPREPTSRDW